MPRARVSRGAAARTVVPTDKYLYVHSRVDIARIQDVACMRVSFVDVKKKGFTFRTRSAAGFYAFALTRSLGISFF